MNGKAVGWGLVFLAAGLLVLLGLLPGSAGWAIGPRLGLGTLLAVFGLVFLVGSFAGSIRARTAAIEGKGGCPVGATCACGHFNFKPRKACRQCGAATTYAA